MDGCVVGLWDVLTAGFVEETLGMADCLGLASSLAGDEVQPPIVRNRYSGYEDCKDIDADESLVLS